MLNGQMLINGALVDGADQLDVINPATGQPFARIARANSDQLEEAVAAAKAAAPAWAALSYEERGAMIAKLADALDAQKDAIAKLVTTEQGKPLAQAMGEVIGIS